MRLPAGARVGAAAPFLAGATDLQQTAPLILVLTILSILGAAITFAILIWAILRFRDPATKGRRYG